MPQPPFEPTEENRRMVTAMVGYGIPQLEIASIIGINRTTLAKYFRDEIDTATARANARVAERLFQKALEGDTRASMFWLERRGGDAWAHKPQVTLIPGDFTIDLSGNSRELLEADD